MKIHVDQQYISERDKLIPEAEKRANKEFGAHAPGGGKNVHENEANLAYYENWSRVFHSTMDRLWRERKGGTI